jgi:hypothetical protein
MSDLIRKKYKGQFNVCGQVFSLVTQAINKNKAYHNFVFQLVKKTNIPRFQLLSIFGNCKDTYSIVEE